MQCEISLLLLAYNQARFVEDAARSCLAQIGDPIEIIFSDDHSTDGTYELLLKIAQEYRGPHLVSVRQNRTNVGISEHYNTLVQIASGSLMVTAAGDDISMPYRISKIKDAWNRSNKKFNLIASYATSMNYEGHKSDHVFTLDQLEDWKTPDAWCKKRPYVIGATHAFTKKLWSAFGDISSDVHHEDQVVSFRAACLGSAFTIAEPLIWYREGGLSSSNVIGKSNLPNAKFIRRFNQQKAVFQQVRDDLYTINRHDLWSGKVKRYYTRALTALSLFSSDKEFDFSFSNFLTAMKECGVFWSIRYIFYAKKHLADK